MTWTEGTILGEDTRLVAELDHADGATLWYARDAEHDRDAMVEVARPGQWGDGAALLTFHSAAEAAMALRHPALLSVFDHGLSEDGAPYVIREPMPSGNVISAIHHGGAMGLRPVARIVEQLLRVLDLVQPRGLAVVGLTPDNVFLVGDGTAEVKLWVQLVSQVPSRAAIDTGCVAPDRLKESPVCDPRVALWEVGALAHYALTAAAPFGASSGPDFEAEVARGGFRRLALDGEGGEASRIELDAFFRKALALELDDRFQSAREMLDSWQSVAGGLLLFVDEDDEGRVTTVSQRPGLFADDEVTRAFPSLSSLLDEAEEDADTVISVRPEDLADELQPAPKTESRVRSQPRELHPDTQQSPPPLSRRTEFPLTRSVKPAVKASGPSLPMLGFGMLVVAGLSSVATTWFYQPAGPADCDCAAQVAEAHASDCSPPAEGAPGIDAASAAKTEPTPAQEGAPALAAPAPTGSATVGSDSAVEPQAEASARPAIWPSMSTTAPGSPRAPSSPVETTDAPQAGSTTSAPKPAVTSVPAPPPKPATAPADDPDDPYF